MGTRMKVLPENDSKYIYETLVELGVNGSGLGRLLDCSNVIVFWNKGYRRIPKAFRRAILMLKFINKKGLMSEFLRYAHEEETRYAETQKDSPKDVNPKARLDTRNDSSVHP